MKITVLVFAIIGSGFMVLNQKIDDTMKQEAPEISVMSYNIRFANPGDGVNAWANRSDFVAEMMGDKHGADIIGVQEALKHQITDLQDMLPGYSWVGVGRDDGRDKGEFSPIFYNADRFDLLVTNTFWLSETPDVPGSRSWDAAITRVATWAKFRDRNSDREFYVLNTHFDHIGEQARIESAKMIDEFVAGLEGDLPVIVTGDLNVQESSEAYSILAGSPHLRDARYASQTEHDGPTASFSDWEELREAGSRIDYIFVNDKVDVLTHSILDDRYDGRFPSDHLPVLSKIVLN